MLEKALLMLCVVPALVFSQKQPALSEPLARALKEDSLHIYRNTLAKPYLKIDNRNSFILREPVDFYGGMIGATFWSRHTIAIGYYFLDKKSQRPVTLDNDLTVSQQFLRLNYVNFAYQLVILNRRYVQVHVPVEIGAGSFYAKRSDSGAVMVTRHYNGRFIPFSVGVQAIGKITRWLGISVTGGYRYVQNDEVLLKFNGMYYSYGVWVDARQVIRNFLYYKAKKKYARLQAGAK